MPMPELYAKFNVQTTVKLSHKPVGPTGESHAKNAITMVFADSVNNTVIICIGSSLQMCDPPEALPHLLAGSQHHCGFRDGNRTEARLSTVNGVAVDRDQLIIFTDFMNNCVREITPSGQVRTICGPLPQSESPFAQLSMHGAYGFDDGVAHQARFHRPWGICLHHNDTQLFVVDCFNSNIRRINRATAYVSTVSTAQDMSPDPLTLEVSPPNQLFNPTTIRRSKHGRDLYVVSGSCHQIFCINIETMKFCPVMSNRLASQVLRPVCLDLTSTDALLVGYTGTSLSTQAESLKCV